MQFICKSVINNEHFAGGDCMVFSISKEYAQELIQRRAACMEFLKAQGEKYSGKVILGWESSLSAFTSSVLKHTKDGHVIAAFIKAEAHREIEEIPEAFDADAYDNDDFDVVRLRFPQVIFYVDGDMLLTAYEKHSGVVFESEEFQLDLLEKVLNG
jgi:hypothetical protein